VKDEEGATVKRARLGDGDAYAPFRFHIGDDVALRRENGTPDPDTAGTIVGGTCEYHQGGGSYRDVYEVERRDGAIFCAPSIDLVKRDPAFGSNLREAARILREWRHPERG
jgi:hypothetical protein